MLIRLCYVGNVVRTHAQASHLELEFEIVNDLIRLYVKLEIVEATA